MDDPGANYTTSFSSLSLVSIILLKISLKRNRLNFQTITNTDLISQSILNVLARYQNLKIIALRNCIVVKKLHYLP